MVDTRRTRDLGVAIARVLMQVNLIGESRTLDLPSRVRSLVRTPVGNLQGIEDGFDLTIGGTHRQIPYEELHQQEWSEDNAVP